MGTPTTPWNNPGFDQPLGDDGFGLDMPSANLVAAYEPGDLRKAATIIVTFPAFAPPRTPYSHGFVVPTLLDGVSILIIITKAYQQARYPEGGGTKQAGRSL